MAGTINKTVKSVPKKTSRPTQPVKARNTKDFAAKVGRLNSK